MYKVVLVLIYDSKLEMLNTLIEKPYKATVFYIEANLDKIKEVLLFQKSEELQTYLCPIKTTVTSAIIRINSHIK